MHDCDETFNFWEPLHYLVYGHGLQTWEHSPEHALRSYLYLSLHYAVAKPVALLAGDARGKLLVFTLVRLALGVASAASEAWLCAETAALSPIASGVLAALLAGSPACSPPAPRSSAHSPCTSSPSLPPPPSRAATASVAPRASSPSCGVGPSPASPRSLTASPPVAREVSRAHVEFVLGPLVVSLLLAAAVDTHFYGRPTLSTLNLLKYNVVGSGGSELYGVEPAAFYAKNLFNAFNVAAAASALAAPLAATVPGATGEHLRRLLVAHAPFPIFIAFFSLVPHKEERFMYTVYPSLCLGAGVAIAAVAETTGRAGRVAGVERIAERFATACVWGFTAVSVVLGASRVAALTPATARLCARTFVGRRRGHLGACAWARNGIGFPRRFTLPLARVSAQIFARWFRRGASMPFDRAAGGTRHAPPGLNDANEADPRQWTANGSGACDWVVDFVAEGFVAEGCRRRGIRRGSRGSRVTADTADVDERNEARSPRVGTRGR